MPYYDKIVEVTELILQKVKEVKNALFVTIGFLIMDSNFKILYATVGMIWPC